MRISLFFIIPLLFASSCAQKPTYTKQQRDAVVAKFQPYCSTMQYGPGNWVNCDGGATYFRYQNPNGVTHMGRILSYDSETGQLNVLWGMQSERIMAEVFYPGTSTSAHPGKIIEVIPLDADFLRWQKANREFLGQPNPVMSQ